MLNVLDAERQKSINSLKLEGAQRLHIICQVNIYSFCIVDDM